MSKYILVLNCGSSSLKFSVMNPHNGDEPFKGIAERLIGTEGEISFKTAAGKKEFKIAASHEAALDKIVEELKNAGLFEDIKAVGHRIVHGGEYFSQSVVVTDDVLSKIEDCIKLAPLHNPAHVVGIKAARHAFPNLVQVVVFDTAFHQHLKEHAYLYAIPYKYYTENKIRRYGFHGTSYRYVAGQMPELLGIEKPKTVICHLGNGGSIAAVDFDHSEDTTMGLTPLEGLVHGTRSGDIDPGAIAIFGELGLDVKGIDNLLWKQSGLLGLSGISNDCRTLEEESAKGNQAARRTLEVYGYRLAKNIAAQAVALNGFDALVFTGGIGENSSHIRKMAVDRLGFLGLALDEKLNNETSRGKQGNIAKAGSKPIWVVPTNEELLIARDTDALSS